VLTVPTVLIADDDPDHRELITLALGRLGHDVVAATDVRSAERAIAAGGIDAVLLDVRMPGTSGIELCGRLRAAPATAHLPIMLVSADVNNHRIRAGLDAGADDYLTKPYRRDELRSRMESLLSRGAVAATGPATVALLAARSALPRAASVLMSRPVSRTA
jgi:DNA-binding response OmpR family regulator